MRLLNSTGKITTKVPTCGSDQKAEEVKKYILENAAKFETINYIYVLSKSKKLKGIISIHELFGCSPEAYIRNYMATDIVKARPDTDKEKVAYLALKNNIKSVPVVGKENKFIGVVSSDDILNILADEANEDFMLMSGIIPNNSADGGKLSVFKSFVHRTPWIIVGLFGGLLAAKIISGFEGILEREVILAAFIPLIVYMANAVGAQTQTLYIRDLAVSQKVPILKYGLKQIGVSALIGAVCWLVIAGISLIAWQSQLLGAVIGFAVFCSIIAATIFAIGIPFLLVKSKNDPAIGSGPFTTIIQDVLSVLIYFFIASVLMA
ncbi:MAG: magnesium transporter [Patescibacteria group bacterium]|nr:magnesium transporter [Patescibacteria group bacterium]